MTPAPELALRLPRCDFIAAAASASACSSIFDLTFALD